MDGSRRCLLLAVAACLAVWSWQALTVQVNYGGYWTALFCTGSAAPQFPLEPPGTYFFRGTGYDGQWYRAIAYDPFLQSDTWRRLGSERFRYSRIAVPALAWLLAFGQTGWIDTAYFGVILMCIFFGTWWTALLLREHGFEPAWGLAFPLLPGSLVAVDRMTIDVALYALLVGFFLAWKRKAWAFCWLAAAAGLLVRDTGVFTILAAAGVCLLQRDWKKAVGFACAVLPWLLWSTHVSHVTAMPISPAARGAIVFVPKWLMVQPAYGTVLAIIHPFPYDVSPAIETLAQTFDRMALLGLLAAVIATAILARWRRPSLAEILALLYVGVFVLVSGRGFFKDAIGYPRMFTPLLALVAWYGLERRSFLYALPWLLVSLRVLLQLGPQFLGILRAL
jgi:hypothetical protein